MYRYTDEHGEHLHQIEKDGEWKPLTGTSSVLNVLAKPLTWWAVGLALEPLGWSKMKDKNQKWIPKEVRVPFAERTLEQIKTLDGEQWLKYLDESYYAHDKKKNSSAKGGKDLHALIEKYIKDCIENNEGKPLAKGADEIDPFVQWAVVNVDKFLWSEMNCYSETHWLGGISDAGFVDKEGKTAILDIKSSKDAYVSQFIQCAGYDIQITENGGYDSKGEKVFDLMGSKIDYYVIFPFGMDKPEAKLKGNVEDLKAGFLSALQLHRLLN